MKKFFIMAMLAVAATSTYAQDIKSVLKAKDYAEAQSQLNSCLSSLSNEEKAKAYNKLVELSMQKVNKENSTIVENQALQQMGQQAKPVDMQGFYTSLTNALNAAQECDKYDHMPNAKGKVSPKFHKKNQATLWTLRPQLINAGQDCLQKDDNKGALAYYAAYVESGNSSLFADMDKTKAPDTYLGEVARVASVIAFQEKDMETANKYCDVALKDTASYKDALNLKMAMMQQQMKTKEDSVKCLKTFEELYANYYGNEAGYEIFWGGVVSTEIDGAAENFVIADNGDVYLKDAMSTLRQGNWIKGHKAEGDTIVFNFPQKYYQQEAEDEKGNPTGEMEYCYLWRTILSDGRDTFIPDPTSQTIKYVFRNDSLIRVDDFKQGIYLSLADADGVWVGYDGLETW